jgi:hypothetical protein
MKARRASCCTVCRDQIKAGEDIAAFLGKWVHSTCKTADIARRANAAGEPTVLPVSMNGNETITYVGTRRWRRRGIKFLQSRDRL